MTDDRLKKANQLLELMSQRQLAKQIGVDPSNFSRWLHKRQSLREASLMLLDQVYANRIETNSIRIQLPDDVMANLLAKGKKRRKGVHKLVEETVVRHWETRPE